MNVIYKVHGVFGNLYFWGKGWDNINKKIAWDSFWHNLENDKKNKAIFWSFAEKNDSNKSQYLFGIQGSIYLHPMDFNFYGVDGHSSDDNKTPYWITELYKLCTACAETCGGTFEMYVDTVTTDDYKCANTPFTVDSVD